MSGAATFRGVQWPRVPCSQAEKGMRLDTTRAMDDFLTSVERRAFRIARIATGSADEALDIVQDAMLGLVQRYGSRPPEQWAPLFHRILQTRIRDWYRRSRVRNRWRVWLGRGRDQDPDAADDPLAAVADPVGRVPEDELQGRHALAAIESALHALPLRQQQAFLLRSWEGLDVAATARAMGCSEGSVKTHYSRAVHRLRELLEEHRP